MEVGLKQEFEENQLYFLCFCTEFCDLDRRVLVIYKVHKKNKP